MATTTKETKAATKAVPLESMNLKTLRSEYNRIYGLETTSANKDYIRKKIEARRAELAQERAARRAEVNVERDPRPPPVGTVLEREFEGKVHKVTVRETGFEYRRQTYSSLSSVAKAISGVNWNGFGFFKLLASEAAATEEARS